MSKPVFEDVFALHGRRNRKSFILFNLVAFALFLVYVLAVLLTTSSVEPEMALGRSNEAVSILLLLPGVLAYVASTFCVGAQRCRDTGWSGLAILVSVLPLVGLPFYLLLCVAPGNQGINAYGQDPLF